MNNEGVSPLISGLRKLRTGALLQIISVVIGIVSDFITPIYLHTAIGFSMLSSWSMADLPFSLPPSNIIGIEILETIIGILLLIGFIYWFTASDDLENYNRRYEIGRTGAIIVVIGIILVIVEELFLIGMREPPYPGIGAIFSWVISLLGIGRLLAIIGLALFSIMLIRLGDLEEASDTIHIAGILYLIGIVLAFIQSTYAAGIMLILVAVILIYVGVDSALDSLRAI